MTHESEWARPVVFLESCTRLNGTSKQGVSVARQSNDVQRSGANSDDLSDVDVATMADEDSALCLKRSWR